MEIVYGDVNKLNRYKEQVFKLHYNYGLLIWIVQIALEHPLQQARINEYYKEVLSIVEYNKAKIPIKLFNIQIYIPFTSLYSLNGIINQADVKRILADMNQCMGMIDKYCGSYEDSDFWKILNPREQNYYFGMYDYIRKIRRNNYRVNFTNR